MAKVNAAEKLENLKYDPVEELVKNVRDLENDYALAEDATTKANIMRSIITVNTTLIGYVYEKPVASRKPKEESKEKKTHAHILQVIEEAEKEQNQE